MNEIIKDVKKNCVGATILEDGLAIRGSMAKESKTIVESWI